LDELDAMIGECKHHITNHAIKELLLNVQTGTGQQAISAENAPK